MITLCVLNSSVDSIRWNSLRSGFEVENKSGLKADGTLLPFHALFTPNKQVLGIRCCTELRKSNYI